MFLVNNSKFLSTVDCSYTCTSDAYSQFQWTVQITPPNFTLLLYQYYLTTTVLATVTTVNKYPMNISTYSWIHVVGTTHVVYKYPMNISTLWILVYTLWILVPSANGPVGRFSSAVASCLRSSSSSSNTGDWVQLGDTTSRQLTTIWTIAPMPPTLCDELWCGWSYGHFLVKQPTLAVALWNHGIATAAFALLYI